MMETIMSHRRSQDRGTNSSSTGSNSSPSPTSSNSSLCPPLVPRSHPPEQEIGMNSIDYMESGLPQDVTLQNITYNDGDHMMGSFTIMNEMRREGVLCDVNLFADGGKSCVKGHRIILSAASPYFKAMFTNEWPETKESKIILHNIEPGALIQLVEYAYTGSIAIDEDNVQSLLPAASLLQMVPVREACCKFLLRQLHPSNCLGIRSFADVHCCEELQKVSDTYTLENFSLVALTEEFVTLSFEQLETLVSSDRLNVTSEEAVYKAVMRWVSHDLEGRKPKLGSLLKHVRLPLTTRSFLLGVISEDPLIQSSQEGKDLLIEAMKYHLSPEQRVIPHGGARTKTRKPDGLTGYLFAVGGGSLFAIHNECELYHPELDRWFPVAPTIQRRSRCGVIALDRCLYAIGGYNGSKDLNSGELYNPWNGNEWMAMPMNMASRRSSLGICTLNGLIYVGGGFDGASSLSSVERYDPLVETFTSMASMTTSRRYVRMTAIEGAIYSVGGYDGSNCHLSSMERFDPREGIWKLMPSMVSKRSSAGVTGMSSNGSIYVSGGNDGCQVLQSFEKFDLKANAWETLPSMTSRRSTHEMITDDRFIYSIGGNDSSSSLNTVERFDIKSNKWGIISSMSLRRSSLGAAILYCPEVDKFLHPPSTKMTSSISSISSSSTSPVCNSDF